MSNIFLARSCIFYPGYSAENVQELSDEIIIPSYYFNRIIDKYNDGEPLLATITNVDNNMDTVIALGTPHQEDRNIVFVPSWILDLIGCDGYGNGGTIQIDKVDIDIPVATKIIIKPLDPIAFEIDTITCFEKTMLNLHTIREGITIPVYVPELGADFVMFAYIDKVEPASLARIIDGEVDVEFINDFNNSSAIHNTNSVNMPLMDYSDIIESSVLHSLEEIKRPSLEQNSISKEERQEQVRNSWLKRFQNNAK